MFFKMTGCKMINKVILFGIGALFSMAASADYVRYSFTGGDLAGYFVENVNSKQVVAYSFTARGVGSFDPFSSTTPAAGQRSYFYGQLGPTNFSATDNRTGDYISQISISFEGMYSATPTAFSAYFATTKGPGYPYGEFIPPFIPKYGVLHGDVVASAVSAADTLIYDFAFPNSQAPDQGLPEPASVALVAVGALAATGAAIGGRRRKRAA